MKHDDGGARTTRASEERTSETVKGGFLAAKCKHMSESEREWKSERKQ